MWSCPLVWPSWKWGAGKTWRCDFISQEEKWTIYALFFAIKNISPSFFMANSRKWFASGFQCYISFRTSIQETVKASHLISLQPSAQRVLAENLLCVSVPGMRGWWTPAPEPWWRWQLGVSSLARATLLSKSRETGFKLPILPNIPIKWHILHLRKQKISKGQFPRDGCLFNLWILTHVGFSVLFFKDVLEKQNYLQHKLD